MLRQWLRPRRGDVNEDPELKPRRSQAGVFFIVGIAMVVIAILVMSIAGGIMKNREAQAPVEGKTNVTATQ